MPTVHAMEQASGAQAQARSAIHHAASRTDTDFTYLLAQARVESALDSSARARTSSASGLFQFVDQTWLETVHRHGGKHGLSWAANAIETAGGRATIRDPALRAQVMQLRFDPVAASLMAGEHARDNAAFLSERFGRDPEHVELYLAHFLGPKGAATFIRAHHADPSQPAARLFADAAGANRAIFYDHGRARSLDEVRGLFAAKLENAGLENVGADAAFRLMPFAAPHVPPLARFRAGPAPSVDVPRRVPMAEVLSNTFGAGSAAEGGLGERAATHVAQAYGQFARFGL